MMDFIQGNEATANMVQNLLEVRLSNDYSYLAHKALIKVSKMTKRLPVKVKGNKISLIMNSFL